jgi:methyltransferase of ATP-grasp peptide maturase system
MASAARLRQRLVASLRHEGALTDERWADAFRTVPRHLFLPKFFIPEDRGWSAVARGDAGWLKHAYSANVLVTQLDDDPARWTEARSDGPIAGTPTCSSSQPAIMAIMLEELQVRDGLRVLEIGTGTGYNAALLSQRLGSSNVSTVDVDPVLAAQARRSLDEAGYAPACSASDGAQGFPAQAPFDRVICTCAVSTIPLAWLEQTVPGGLIVTTLNRPIGAGLVRITAGEGATGQGRVLARNGQFMPLRADRLANPAELLSSYGETPSATSRTSLQLNAVLNPSNPFAFFAGLGLPGVVAIGRHLLHPDGSWTEHRGSLVKQGGPRRLWDDVERAHAEWTALGEPRRDRFGLTITPEAQVLWLDEPDGRHWALAGPKDS